MPLSQTLRSAMVVAPYETMNAGAMVKLAYGGGSQGCVRAAGLRAICKAVQDGDDHRRYAGVCAGAEDPLCKRPAVDIATSVLVGRLRNILAFRAC